MTNQSNQQLIIWWVLWAALLSGIFIFYFVLGGTAGAPNSATSPVVWLAGVVPVMISVLIRWLILPRTHTAQAAVLYFVVGIVMAEATCFLGLFLFPAHKLELFILSVLGIFQFIPFFARRFYEQVE
jgi:hypothetical protein